MVRFIAIKQFKMKIAARFVGKSLKELPRQTETKGARHILISFGFREALVSQSLQSAPDQIGPSTEINHTARQAFVHGHIRLTRKRILWMKTCAVTPDALFIAQCLRKGLSQRDAAIFNRMVGIHRQITVATQIQIYDCVLCKQRQHVIEKRDACAKIFAFPEPSRFTLMAMLVSLVTRRMDADR